MLLQDIADQLQGGDMHIDYDQILAKRPHSEDAVFAWHQDMAYWPPFTSDISAATCWLAVSDSTEENGCMRFLPGSQKETELRKHAPGEQLQSDTLNSMSVCTDRTKCNMWLSDLRHHSQTMPACKWCKPNIHICVGKYKRTCHRHSSEGAGTVRLFALR